MKFWNITGAFKDVCVIQDIKTSVSDVEYSLPSTALIDAIVFPENQLKDWCFLICLKCFVSEEWGI